MISEGWEAIENEIYVQGLLHRLALRPISFCHCNMQGSLFSSERKIQVQRQIDVEGERTQSLIIIQKRSVSHC